VTYERDDLSGSVCNGLLDLSGRVRPRHWPECSRIVVYRLKRYSLKEGKPTTGKIVEGKLVARNCRSELVLDNVGEEINVGRRSRCRERTGGEGKAGWGRVDSRRGGELEVGGYRGGGYRGGRG